MARVVSKAVRAVTTVALVTIAVETVAVVTEAVAMIAEAAAVVAVTTVAVAAVAVTIVVAAAVVASVEEEDNQSINGILKRGNHVTAEKNEIQKMQKGRVKGMATRGHSIAFGSFALKALEGGWITARQLEAARIAVTRDEA